MVHKEFIDKIAEQLGEDTNMVHAQVDAFLGVLTKELTVGNTVNVQGFGVFESKVKAERRMYNPTTKTFNVIPAKTTLGFKMSAVLKEKLN